ncbi:PEPxxWA-CTERM sorting domain-containing protein [Sandaracinobacter sp. RS1-74]|uniref:PEPxxWA-CTERM sorting domain-containing protein n=1 Tax=Sandaracinobacteroides sayramensis TaxID=2913411 RepID=UPI001ED9DC46|nr:PEPxxWA-CTERM sorting domain-containing protein [Sandaracinobacteroides sayramensis]MCG2840040.1 PEPxxWA-CTERM sorting domain-containing protein [Sandaracinobacteroides sayramensis]
MNFRMLFGALAGAGLLSAAPASAVVVFELKNVTLQDGGQLTGTITTSDDLNTLVGLEITSTSNHNWPYGNFIGRTYNFADILPGFVWNTAQGLQAWFAGPTARLDIFFAQPLTLAGADLAVSANEWQQAAGARAVVSGSLGVVPEPAAWAMMIAGFGLVGASMRRRRAIVAN